ncbi:hypothetical protein IV102_16915 [bacterium]|nr:hypothetical protein [bacterium]
MLNLLRFSLANLLAATLIINGLGQYLHYPPDLPVRINPTLPGLILALCFSLLAPLGLRWVEHRVLRPLLTVAVVPFCVALAGALWALSTHFIQPQVGAQMALLLMAYSPRLSLAGLIWALLWTRWSFPPLTPAPPAPTKAAPADWEALAEPPGEWIGSSR